MLRDHDCIPWREFRDTGNEMFTITVMIDLDNVANLEDAYWNLHEALRDIPFGWESLDNDVVRDSGGEDEQIPAHVFQQACLKVLAEREREQDLLCP